MKNFKTYTEIYDHNKGIGEHIYNNNIYKVIEYINNGEDINKTTLGETLLSISLKYNKIEIIKLILNVKDLEINNTVLAEAILSTRNDEHYDAIKLVVDAGIDLNKQYNNSFPLICCNTSPLSTKYLIDNGANINNQTGYGMSAIHWAVNKQNIKVIKVLVESNCDINHIDINQLTPLLYAAKKYNINENIILYLIDNGADVDAVDNGKNDYIDLLISRKTTIHKLKGKDERYDKYLLEQTLNSFNI